MFFYTPTVINDKAKSAEATFIGLSFFDLCAFFWLGLSFGCFSCCLLSDFLCFFFCRLLYWHMSPPIQCGVHSLIFLPSIEVRVNRRKSSSILCGWTLMEKRNTENSAPTKWKRIHMSIITDLENPQGLYKTTRGI